jgi:23S rRNA (adenine2030-N6)-methyltransferase
MLSYQHSYHAGNPADLQKHIILAELLRLLTIKPRGISYLETHAGRGLYDLSAPEARKTGEAAEGIGKVTLPPRSQLGTVVEKVRGEHGVSSYPGSPMIAWHLLREQDRVILMEKHPGEVEALRQAMRLTAAEVHHRDGYEGVLALAPPEPRRGLVLVDPSYEVKTEYQQAAQFALKLRRKWPEAAIMIWYPLLAAGREAELLAPLAGEERRLTHEVLFDLKGGAGMKGSGVILLNPPFGTEEILPSVAAMAPGVLRQR